MRVDGQTIVAYLLVIINISTNVLSVLGPYKCANDSTLDNELDRKFSHDGSRSSWKVRHHSNVQLYNKYNCKVCVEIGLARGEFANNILANVKSVTEYYGIDPFLGGYDSTDAMSIELEQYRSKANISSSSNRWANTVLYRLRDYGCKFRFYQGLSDDMHVKFGKNSIDCIFIDGDHTYKRAKNDIINYVPLMKPHGVVMFDDYNFEEVAKAVNEFVNATSLRLHPVNTHGQYYVVIPERGGSTLLANLPK